MTDKHAFQRIIYLTDSDYGEISSYLEVIDALLQCMKECNHLHKKDNEYFTLTYRPGNDLLNDPINCSKFTLKWGYKDD